MSKSRKTLENELNLLHTQEVELIEIIKSKEQELERSKKKYP